MAWVFLIFAGLFEVAWTLCTKMSQGYTKLLPTALTIVSMGMSGYFLALAVRNIPISVAYAVWVSMGIVGTFIGSVVWFSEKMSMTTIFFLILILIGIIGLKLSSVD